MQVGAIVDAPVVEMRGGRLLGLVALLHRWHRRAATRAALRELPPQHLRDIGMTPLQAAREAALPFWKP